jgi:dTMP kinase
MRDTYGVTLPGMNLTDLTGRLIVIEGTDGVGRTTQINLLKPWLEQQGRAVLETGMTRSSLAGKGIKQAKEGHTLGRVTLSLFYSTDFADRLENEIVPALRAGFVVLTDRYIYSLIARAMVRDMDAAWIRNAYSFALKPDVVFYLRIGVDDLIPRVVFSRGFDYWESGMDLHPSEDMYESFRKYQTDLLKEFDVLAEEYKFEVIDASADVRTVFEQLRDGVSRVLAGEPLFSIPKPKPAEPAAPETSPKPKPAEEEAEVAAEKAAKSKPAEDETASARERQHHTGGAAPAPEAPVKASEATPAHEGTPHRAVSRAASMQEEKPVAQALANTAEGEAST